MSRIIATPAAPHPQARIDSLDAAAGTALFTWLDAEGQPVDSGGSVARFAPVAGEEPDTFAEPDDETLSTAITDPSPAPLSPADVWAEHLAGVIVDPVTSIPLKANIATRDILTATLLFLREAQTAGYLTEATPQVIWDADNVVRHLTVADLRALLLRYGAAWQAMHAEFAP